MYAVKEIYYTLQGEGAQTGRAAVFLRFAGCNLWSGREADRAEATCNFCDTDFVGTDGGGGGKFKTAQDLAAAISKAWTGNGGAEKFVVFTGGEPLLQLDAALIDAVHANSFRIAIETNGTLEVPKGVDWVCVSPKANAELVVKAGDELKLVYPQSKGEPERYRDLQFKHRFLQPMDNAQQAENTRAAVLEVSNQDFVMVARAKGLLPRTILWNYLMRNALTPIITVTGLQVATLLGGSILVETIFAIPGMGQYLFDSITSRDYPVIQAIVLIAAACVVFVNTLADIAYAHADARVDA